MAKFGLAAVGRLARWEGESAREQFPVQQAEEEREYWRSGGDLRILPGGMP
jgi:hypothetical protein